MAKKSGYNASDINALSLHNHLLKRISLTFGNETGTAENPFSSQKTVSIREITDNAVDEVIGGYADKVNVRYHEDGSIEVQDNGRGLPVDTGHDSEGRPVSGIYITMGIIQSGGKFSTDAKRFSSGLNGVGGSSTQNLSRRFDVTVYRNKKKYSLSFQNGIAGFFAKDGDPDSEFTPIKDLTYLKVEKDDRKPADKKAYKTGTNVRVWLNNDVFSSRYPINTLDITDRLRGTAYLVPALTIHILDEINKFEDPATGKLVPRDDTFHFEEGISSLVSDNINGSQLGPVFEFDAQTDYIEKNVPVFTGDKVVNQDLHRVLPVKVAFAWQNNYDYNMESYVNTIRTRLGGVHEKAFEKALTTAFSNRLRSMQGMLTRNDPDLKFDDFKEGLVAVVYAQVAEPLFTAQAKEELGGPEVQRVMTKLLTDKFTEFAQNPKNTEAIKTVGAKIVEAARARRSAQQEKDLKRKKHSIENSGDMPVKLVDCEITHNDDSEFYIVEGDSALSALLGARDSQYQALFPIRGKIINALKSTPAKVLANQEVQGLIKCLGAGSGSTFDMDKLRYGRVFIAADADPDGGNIASLITVLFWQLFRPIVESGNLYRILTPLFLIETGKGKKAKKYYAENDREKDIIVADLDKQGVKYTLKRLKGLGEGGADVLSDTGMNPETRTVQQVVLRDVELAQKMIDTTLGEDVSIRKEWIVDNPIDEMENLE